MSHPVRGAWIEIASLHTLRQPAYRRTPLGVRGLKFDPIIVNSPRLGRTPSGVRGLKFSLPSAIILATTSHPVRGAWIEMGISIDHPAYQEMSHPVRGAWIEIRASMIVRRAFSVAPRQGCVDLNNADIRRTGKVDSVAPRQGCVD